MKMILNIRLETKELLCYDKKCENCVNNFRIYVHH